ncbi:MAG: cyclase family protein [Candidatus Lokiarchaeota archaeon]|nr:cyclase family protein [Candidatus Lokiarchaeota archaeon]
MSKFIDLSHDFEDNMPGFKLKNEDGSITQYTVKIHPFLTHEQTKLKYKGMCSFEITEMTFQTSVGTYLDSPFHRYPDGRDISEIMIDEVILPGVVIDVRGRREFEAIGTEIIPSNLDLKDKAVFFNFGWDKHWGTEQYQSYPFISKELIEYLIKSGIKLAGVDTVNIDNSRDLTRPAHSLFLKEEIVIVENLINLDKLHNKKFRFFAVPIKGKKVAAMPIRAFAEIL